MTKIESKTFVRDLFDVFFRREPSDAESETFVAMLANGVSEAELFRRFKESHEFVQNRGVKPGHPPGHYYSPVVDVEEAARYWNTNPITHPEKIPGVPIRMSEMRRVWDELQPFVETTSFPTAKTDAARFYTDNPFFPVGDAAILRAMILARRPSRIIEVGSGLSSACMLDALDEAGLVDTHVTFIEPYPQRLRSTLRPADEKRVTILEQPVQATDPALFAELGGNDIFFVDSTHVMKTASDVNFELFEALPRLAPGVLVHFHDVPYPFEYPKVWVFDRRYSWNEAYALRAFLMFNEAFHVEYWNPLFFGANRDLVGGACPAILTHCGSGIWIRRL